LLQRRFRRPFAAPDPALGERFLSILGTGREVYFFWRCSRTQLFSSSPVLSLHVSRILARRASASFAWASHLPGSFLWAHISRRMQSCPSSPLLPSQALRAFSCAALALATRSSQALGSFAFEQSKRRSAFGLGASEGAWARTGAQNASTAAESRILSMRCPFGRWQARAGPRPTTRRPGAALT